MLDFIQSNYEWFFSGLGIVIISFIFKFFKKNDNEDSRKSPSKISQTGSDNKNISVIGSKSVNVNVLNLKNDNLKEKTGNKLTLDERKAKTNILFIDDEKFSIVNSIKKTEGWENTKWKKDITSRPLKSHI